MTTSSTNILNAAKQLATQLNNIPPRRLGENDCTYALPREESSQPENRDATMDAFHTREMLVAAAHVIDPTINLNQSVLNCSLTFHGALAKFPTHRIHAVLDDIQKDLARSALRNEHGIHFAVSKDSAYHLDFVLRAALPSPEPLSLQFLLPAGQFRDGNGNKVSGEVSHEKLLELMDTADREQNHEALTELHQSRCISADISDEQAQKLDARLGLNLAAGKAR